MVRMTYNPAEISVNLIPKSVLLQWNKINKRTAYNWCLFKDFMIMIYETCVMAYTSGSGCSILMTLLVNVSLKSKITHIEKI